MSIYPVHFNLNNLAIKVRFGWEYLTVGVSCHAVVCTEQCGCISDSNFDPHEEVNVVFVTAVLPKRKLADFMLSLLNFPFSS
jgi:hypothetical protein